jgi:hypothetical protein
MNENYLYMENLVFQKNMLDYNDHTFYASSDMNKNDHIYHKIFYDRNVLGQILITDRIYPKILLSKELMMIKIGFSASTAQLKSKFKSKV